MNLAERFLVDEDGWRLTESRFRRELTPALESVFAAANGYLGVRGTPEEGACVSPGDTGTSRRFAKSP